MSDLLNIEEVNKLGDEQFVWMFGNVIELCTDAAAKVGLKRPFRTVQLFCEAFYSYLDALPQADKVNILRLHPDLAGKMAEQGKLTQESAHEQFSAGLNEMDSDQKDVMNYYNKHYKEKFGFPFVICARENKVTAILEGLTQRYNNTSAQEITTAVEEVKKICRLRILDIVCDG